MAKEQASRNDNADENSFYKIYFQKVASLPQYKGLTFIDSDEYLISEEIEEREKKVGRDVVEFWGEGLTQRDYDFLEREFNNLTTRYECDSYVQEMLFKQIAFQSLDIMNKRLKGIDTNRELEHRRYLNLYTVILCHSKRACVFIQVDQLRQFPCRNSKATSL